MSGETPIIGEIVKWCEARPSVFPWVSRINCGGFRSRAVGAKKGTPDVLACCWDGRLLACEVKLSDKSPWQPAQLPTLSAMARSGARVCLVLNLQDFVSCVERWTAP